MNIHIYNYLKHNIKFPSIVSELDSLLLLAKIKGEVVLALLAAPSYVHVPSPLQVKWPVPKS
jgi:hypothetical protein